MTPRDIMQATAAAMTLFIGGCVASPESYLAAHPEMSAHLAASMRQGDVVEGMTRDQVRLIWGMPDSKADWSEGDSWTYTRSFNGRHPTKLREIGGVPSKSDGTQQNQTSPGSSFMSESTPRRMVYFRGEQVVLVEKAAGEL